MNITNTFGSNLKMIDWKVTSRIIENMKPKDFDTLEGQDLNVCIEGLISNVKETKTLVKGNLYFCS